MQTKRRTSTASSALYKVEVWYWNKIRKTRTHISTVAYSKPYSLAKSIKRLEDLKNHPVGTYTKMVKQ